MFQGNQISRSAMILMVVGLFGAAGCASETADEQPEASATEMPAEAPEGMGEMSAPHGQVSVVMYQCADDKQFALTVAPGVGQAALRTDGEVFQLEQQEVASGMEFSDGTYTFRGQGPEAFVEKDGERIYTDCVAAGHPETVEE
jgi:membrane-bound inhibitor of C-type lysozyme